MNLNKNLIFLGMMGSGKSSIGYLVSKKLNLNFFETKLPIKDFPDPIIPKKTMFLFEFINFLY